jgi:hypothetical protein
MRVTLWLCRRCQLQWVADEQPKTCPQCRRHFSGVPVIQLVDRDMEVESVGENLRLGCRCPHGMICNLICAECSATKAA